MVYDVTPFVLSFKCYGSVVHIGDLIPLGDEFVDHIQVSSVRSGDEEAVVPVVEHDSSLAFKSLTLGLEMGKIDAVLVLALEIINNGFGPFSPPTFVKHWVKDQDTARYGLALVAREPIGED